MGIGLRALAVGGCEWKASLRARRVLIPVGNNPRASIIKVVITAVLAPTLPVTINHNQRAPPAFVLLLDGEHT